jgi:uncharacterized protein (DUF2141 family)
MRKYALLAAAAFAACQGILLANGEKSGEITLLIKGFENEKGMAQVALYSGKEGFPSDYKKALKILGLAIKDKEAKGTFKDVTFGEYAVAVLHDENRNGKMDTNIFGVPREGYGTSRDARGSWGPPAYDDAKFKLNSDKLRLTINMTY